MLRRESLLSTQLPMAFEEAPAFKETDTTHSGGKGEPLHDWYAYLEGYSSAFVRSVYARYMPDARLVLDPFAGVGTTPLNLALMGVNSVYCELNPVLRRVIDIKLFVAKLTAKDKQALARSLLALADELDALVAAITPAQDILSSYQRCFGKSIFFSPDGLQSIARLRAVSDELSISNPQLSAALDVAIISQLVNCSLLKRAGDVRFRTEKELSKGIPSLTHRVKEHLRLLSRDALECPRSTGKAQQLSSNAKDLGTAPPRLVDGVITSPPYLNGTNYFRNTKLELWYLREIDSGADLRQYRNGAITSGINDVTREKGKLILPEVAAVHGSLTANCYDRRIPAMVAGYFQDMHEVLTGIFRSLRPGAPACIDIGDSIYGGVHIPTDQILLDIASGIGFHCEDSQVLRKRTSKGGGALHQSLIVIRKPTGAPPSRIETSTNGDGAENWEQFKGYMPHQQHPYSKRNWGHPLHSVCSYQGKMKPSLAHHLVRAFSEPGNVVVDPFSGSGSIPFEAALLGREAYGIELGLVPTAISNAKLMDHSHEACSAIIDQLEASIRTRKASADAIASAAQFGFNKKLPDYFHPKTLEEILIAREFFQETAAPDNGDWSLVFSCMLHVLHGNRPYALSRRSHPITPYAPTGDFEYRSVVEKLRAKVMLSLRQPRGDAFKPGLCVLADSLAAWPDSIPVADAIITSPPFANSTRFFMTNWMRYWFGGWDSTNFSETTKDFVEVKQKKSMSVYADLLNQCAGRLKPGAPLILHLGSTAKLDMMREIQPLASPLFETLDAFDESAFLHEKHGLKDKGATTSHQYLVLRRN